MKYLKTYKLFENSVATRKSKIEKTIKLIADSLQAIFDDYEISGPFSGDTPIDDIYWEYSYNPINPNDNPKKYIMVDSQINICNIDESIWNSLSDKLNKFVESINDGLYGDIPNIELDIEETACSDIDVKGILTIRFEDSLQDII